MEAIERRFTTHPVEHRVEKRDEGGTEKEYHIIEGIAAKVGSRTNLGWMDEIIEPGAFDEALADPDLDCRCLFNHDPSQILARKNKTSATLELFLTDEGHLAYRYTTPNRTYALDLQDAIANGDVTQSSFAFRIKEQSWVWADEGSNDNDLRKVIKIAELRDVSPVTYPAYEDTLTEVAKRSYDEAKKEGTNNEEQRQASKPLQRDLYEPLINSL